MPVFFNKNNFNNRPMGKIVENTEGSNKTSMIIQEMYKTEVSFELIEK